MSAVVSALLDRHAALGIRNLTGRYEVRTHTNYDSATFRSAPETIRSQAAEFQYALVMCDLWGSGSGMSRIEMEKDLELRLSHCGWKNRSAAVVIDPELDVWMWQRTPHFAEAIRWGAESIPCTSGLLKGAKR